MPQKYTLETAIDLLRSARKKLHDARVELQERAGQPARGMCGELRWTSVEQVLTALRDVVHQYEGVQASLRVQRVCTPAECEELEALAKRMEIDQ